MRTQLAGLVIAAALFTASPLPAGEGTKPTPPVIEIPSECMQWVGGAEHIDYAWQIPAPVKRGESDSYMLMARIGGLTYQFCWSQKEARDHHYSLIRDAKKGEHTHE